MSSREKLQAIVDTVVEQYHKRVVEQNCTIDKEEAQILERLVKIQGALEYFTPEPIEELSDKDTDELLKLYQSSSTICLGEELAHDPAKP